MKVAKLYPNAILPSRKNPTDAGLDLYAYCEGEYEYPIFENDVVLVKTGIAIEIPKGYFGWITNKSSKDYLIGGGIIDEGYRGELIVKIINTSQETIYLSHGDAIAQLLIVPCYKPVLEEVTYDELKSIKTDRGEDGGIMRQLGTFALSWEIGKGDNLKYKGVEK